MSEGVAWISIHSIDYEMTTALNEWNNDLQIHVSILGEEPVPVCCNELLCLARITALKSSDIHCTRILSVGGT